VTIPLQKRLLTLKEAAVYLAVSEFTLRRRVWANQIPVIQNGKYSRLLFDIRDLDRYIEQHKTKTA
jgi:excisionase family DNA binding protein